MRYGSLHEAIIISTKYIISLLAFCCLVIFKMH